MRKIRLRDTDGVLFDEEMVPQDFEYLTKHKAAFCRMWTEQGQTFWRRYVEVFRSYILRYSLLGDLACDAAQLQGTLEFAFVIITTHFIEGKVNQAKSLLNQIADLGKNRHRFVHLDSKSVIKDPFYTKETRDIFREFFGPASEKSSYIKVYLLTPVYMKFGGSIIRCLTKWMEAEEIASDDDSYYVRPSPIEINTPLCTKHPRSTSSSPSAATLLCAFHLEDCNNKFYLQYVRGVPSTPVQLEFWEKKDPRFHEPENPLWNPGAPKGSDWRDGLTIEKFQEFYAWCSFNSAIISLASQCQDCRARRKARKKNKKKKKKGAAANLADFGYDDVSIAIDSQQPWSGANGAAGVKPLVVVIGEEACDKNCPLGGMGCLLSGGGGKHANEYDRLLADIQQGKKPPLTLVCTRKPDCNCALCFINRPACEDSDDWVDDDSDSLADLDMYKSYSQLNETKKMVQASLAKAQQGKKSGPATVVLDTRTVETGKQKVLFGAKTTSTSKTRDTLKLYMPSGGHLQAIFDITTKSDSQTGATETKVTFVDAGLLPGMLAQDVIKSDSVMVLGFETIPPLTTQYLSKTAGGVPVTSCLEVQGQCVVEVDYSKLEKAADGKKSTHFVLGVCDPSLSFSNIVKALVIEMLKYVVRRKKRPSAGWIPNQDDILAFHQTLGFDNLQLKGVNISITTGGSAVDCLNRDYLSGANLAKGLSTILTMAESNAVTVVVSSGPPPAQTKNPATNSKARSQTTSITIPKIGSAPADRPGSTKTKKKKKSKKRENEGEEMAVPGTNATDGAKACTKRADNKQVQDAGKRDEATGPVNNHTAVKQAAVAPTQSKSPADTVKATDVSLKEKVKVTEQTNKQEQEQSTRNKTTASTNKDISAKLNESPDKSVGTKPPRISDIDESLKLEPSRLANPPEGSIEPQSVISSEEDASEVKTNLCEPQSVTCSEEDASRAKSTPPEPLSSGEGDAAQAKSTPPEPLRVTSGQGDAAQAKSSPSEPLSVISGEGDAAALSSAKSRTVRVCRNCGITEPAPRTFKKCSKCKEQKVEDSRYYCGGPCQLADWKTKHRDEHTQGLL